MRPSPLPRRARARLLPPTTSSRRPLCRRRAGAGGRPRKRPTDNNGRHHRQSGAARDFRDFRVFQNIAIDRHYATCNERRRPNLASKSTENVQLRNNPHHRCMYFFLFTLFPSAFLLRALNDPFWSPTRPLLPRSHNGRRILESSRHAARAEKSPSRQPTNAV